MRYAFMTFSCPKLSLPEVLDLARRAGYDGIEPRIGAGHAHGIETGLDADARRAVREQAQAASVAIACIAAGVRFADPAITEAAIADTHAAIDLAGDLGCSRVRVFGGKLGEGLTRADAIALVADSLGSVADHAAQRGVTVCMETHDSWCDPRHVAEVLKRADHPALGANWDLMHPVRNGLATIDESFEILRPWIRHLHIHDAVADANGFMEVPMGTGGIDNRRAIERLLEIDFDGYLSGEWIKWSDPAEVHLPREIKTLKQYEAQARKGQ